MSRLSSVFFCRWFFGLKWRLGCAKVLGKVREIKADIYYCFSRKADAWNFHLTGKDRALQFSSVNSQCWRWKFVLWDDFTYELLRFLNYFTFNSLSFVWKLKRNGIRDCICMPHNSSPTTKITTFAGIHVLFRYYDFDQNCRGAESFCKNPNLEYSITW